MSRKSRKKPLAAATPAVVAATPAAADPRPWLFKKGNSSAVGHGRPRSAVEVRDLCRAVAPAAVKVLVTAMMTAPSTRDRIRAGEILLERGYGRAPQAITLTGENGGPIQVAAAPLHLTGLTDEQLAQLRSIHVAIQQQQQQRSDVRELPARSADGAAGDAADGRMASGGGGPQERES